MLFFACKVCGKQFGSVQLAYACSRLRVARRRFPEGTKVSYRFFWRDFKGSPPDENLFAVRGGLESEKLMADPIGRLHRWQVRVRWLGFGKAERERYLYEDDLDPIRT
jgi:hypothetical protein